MISNQESVVKDCRKKAEEWNMILANKEPREILEYFQSIFTLLYQTTSFGLTGLVIMDMLEEKLPVIYIDTCYNFKETLELVDECVLKYGLKLHRFYPIDVSNQQEFQEKYGDMLWQTNPDQYDYLVKAEPGHRAMVELKCEAVITGRRRSQGKSRATLPIVELDESIFPPVFKINPLMNWTFEDCWDYVKRNTVPYNKLHDQGYKSIGDYHSTEPTKEGEGERDGRWRGQEKTECGLHKDYFRMKMAANAKKAEKKRLESL